MNLSFSGLGTVTFVPGVSANHVFSASISLPSPRDGGLDSALVVTINKDGSPVYTSNPGQTGFRVVIPLLTSDTVTMVFSSSAASDQPLNVIKSTISISQGE